MIIAAEDRLVIAADSRLIMAAEGRLIMLDGNRISLDSNRLIYSRAMSYNAFLVLIIMPFWP